MDSSEFSEAQRSAEEVAWDEEFRNETQSDPISELQGLLKFALRLPGALVQMPMALVPDETAQHARAAAREGFLAVRSLLGAVGDSIEQMLAEPSGTSGPATTVQGPPGTWGTGRASMTGTGGTSSPKVKRIEVSESDGVDNSDGLEPSTSPGDMP
jgi:hypothetical protein